MGMSLSVTSVKFEQSFSVVDNSFIQKQPFAEVLQNKCSQKFCIIHRKTHVLRSLILIGLRALGLHFYKKRLQHRILPYCEFFKNRFFTEHFRWLLLLMSACQSKTKYFHVLVLSLACKCKERWTEKDHQNNHQSD